MTELLVPALCLGGAIVALSLFGLSFLYPHFRPRPLPSHSRLFAWFPKYTVVVPLYSPADDANALRHELEDWLAPAGFQFQSCEENELIFIAVAVMGASVIAKMPVTIELEGDELEGDEREVDAEMKTDVVARSRQGTLTLQYQSSVLFDTGDLLRIGLTIADKRESGGVDDACEEGLEDTGNPYQAPS